MQTSDFWNKYGVISIIKYELKKTFQDNLVAKNQHSS